MTWSEKVSKLKKGKVSRDGRHWTTQRMQERMPMMDVRMEAIQKVVICNIMKDAMINAPKML